MNAEQTHSRRAAAYRMAAERLDRRAAIAGEHGYTASADGFSALAEQERRNARRELAAAAAIMRQGIADAIARAEHDERNWIERESGGTIGTL